ncbi:MAG: hypothetical protein ACRD1T_09310 [Acidimicrobiia bacterium]
MSASGRYRLLDIRLPAAAAQCGRLPALSVEKLSELLLLLVI